MLKFMEIPSNLEYLLVENIKRLMAHVVMTSFPGETHPEMLKRVAKILGDCTQKAAAEIAESHKH